VPCHVAIDKEVLERYLESLYSGQPFAPPEGGWTIDNLLALAGVCYLAAFSQGPPAFKKSPDAWQSLPQEQREASEQKLILDLKDAIVYCSYLATLVRDKQFDEKFEPHVEIVFYRDETGRYYDVPAGSRGPNMDSGKQ
jgi:hypothetical protein